MKARLAATALAAFAAGFWLRGMFVAEPPPAAPSPPVVAAAPAKPPPPRVLRREPTPASEEKTPPVVEGSASVAPVEERAAETPAAPAPSAPPTLVVLGRCVDEAGAPIARVRVHVVDRSAAATSGEDGRFEVEGVPLGSATVNVFPDGVGHAARRMTLPAARDGRVDLGDVVLRRGGQIRGRFTDLARRPVPGARVWLDSEEAGWLVVARTTTDADGRFVLEHVGDGVHTVSARSPSCTFDGGAQDAWVSPVLADGRDVSLVVRSAHWVHLRYVDETGGSVGLFHGRATWTALDDPSDGETFQWDGGGWNQGRIPVRPGVVYEVRYDCPGYLPLVQRVEGGEEYERRVELVFRRAPR